MKENWKTAAECVRVTTDLPEMRTAWDNIDHGEEFGYLPDPLEDLAKEICIKECPVREICLRKAAQEVKSDGIRGGFRFHMGGVEHRDATKIRFEHGIKTRILRVSPYKSQRGEIHDGDSVQEMRSDG